MAERCHPGGCLLLLCGLPGAGKSTLARRIVRDFATAERLQALLHAHGAHPRAVCVCLDDIQRGLLMSSGAAPATSQGNAEPITGMRSAPCVVAGRDGDRGRCESGDDGVGAAAGGPAGEESEELLAWKQARCAAKQEAEAALATGEATLVVVDDNFYYRSMRYTFCQLARKYRVGLLTVVVECDVTLALERNRQRCEAERVPDAVIEKMAARLELPDPSAHAWERNTLFLNSAEADAWDRFEWERVAQAWLDPLLDEDEAEKRAHTAAQDRAKTRDSFLHALDLHLRQQVGRAMQDFAACGGGIGAGEGRQVACRDKQVRAAFSKALAANRKRVLERARASCSEDGWMFAQEGLLRELSDQFASEVAAAAQQCLGETSGTST